jgi:hypothetical protein
MALRTCVLASKYRRGLEILKYGQPAPLAPQTLYYDNHVLEFDPAKRTPKWVAEHITRNHVEPVVEVKIALLCNLKSKQFIFKIFLFAKLLQSMGKCFQNRYLLQETKGQFH